MSLSITCTHCWSARAAFYRCKCESEKGGGHTVRQVLAAHKDTVQVALSAAVGDIAPVLLLLNLPQLGKPVQDANLRPRVIAAPQCTSNIIFCTPANELNAGIPDTFIQ